MATTANTDSTVSIHPVSEERLFDKVYTIESESKYSIASNRKVNRVRLIVKKRVVNGNYFMKTTIQVINQAGSANVMEMKGGKKGFKIIRDVMNNETAFRSAAKKAKKNSDKYLTNRQAKSVDQYLTKFSS